MPNISAKFVIRKTYQQSEQCQNSTGKSYGKYDMHARGRGSRSRCSVHFVLVIRNVGSRVLPFREFRLYYNSQQINLNPFFDWLEITKSGKEWILQHLLSEYIDLIDAEPVPSLFHGKLPKQITSLIASSYLVETEFITFGRGI